MTAFSEAQHLPTKLHVLQSVPSASRLHSNGKYVTTAYMKIKISPKICLNFCQREKNADAWQLLNIDIKYHENAYIWNNWNVTTLAEQIVLVIVTISCTFCHNKVKSNWIIPVSYKRSTMRTEWAQTWFEPSVYSECYFLSSWKLIVDVLSS